MVALRDNGFTKVIVVRDVTKTTRRQASQLVICRHSPPGSRSCPRGSVVAIGLPYLLPPIDTRLISLSVVVLHLSHLSSLIGSFLEQDPTQVCNMYRFQCSLLFSRFTLKVSFEFISGRFLMYRRYQHRLSSGFPRALVSFRDNSNRFSALLIQRKFPTVLFPRLIASLLVPTQFSVRLCLV